MLVLNYENVNGNIISIRNTNLVHDKLHRGYDKDDKYTDVVKEMYDNNVLDDDDIKDLDLSKEKDDFKR